MFFMSCVCYAFVRVCLYVLCGHLLGKGWPLGSRLWCLNVIMSFSHWYPGSGVVLDCINSWSLHLFLHIFWYRTICKAFSKFCHRTSKMIGRNFVIVGFSQVALTKDLTSLSVWACISLKDCMSLSWWYNRDNSMSCKALELCLYVF